MVRAPVSPPRSRRVPPTTPARGRLSGVSARAATASTCTQRWLLLLCSTTGVAGCKNFFTIQTKDSYGNRCVYSDTAKDKFVISVKPVHSLLPELETFMRKYEASPIITDNEDGTQSVRTAHTQTEMRAHAHSARCAHAHRA